MVERSKEFQDRSIIPGILVRPCFDEDTLTQGWDFMAERSNVSLFEAFLHRTL